MPKIPYKFILATVLPMKWLVLLNMGSKEHNHKVMHQVCTARGLSLQSDTGNIT